MQLHSSADNQGPAPSATSLVVFLVVCALLAFVAWR
jgi:hypothetical protein